MYANYRIIAPSVSMSFQYGCHFNMGVNIYIYIYDFLTRTIVLFPKMNISMYIKGKKSPMSRRFQLSRHSLFQFIRNFLCANICRYKYLDLIDENGQARCDPEGQAIVMSRQVTMSPRCQSEGQAIDVLS